MSLVDLAFSPFWLPQLFTSAKSFEDNGLIKNKSLNRWGLHAARVRAAHRVANARREQLAHLVSASDREAFERDGFIVRENFLPPDTYATLRAEIEQYRGKAKEKLEGDTLMRKIALDAATLAALPTTRAMLESPEWLGLIAFVGGRRVRPTVLIESLFRHFRPGAEDPQSRFHTDTFHPTVKAWFYLNDVAEDAGPLVYVPGSHRLTEARLEWETAQALAAPHAADSDTRQGSFRVQPSDFAALGLEAPRALAVPANTLVVADTHGFHARGPSAGPSQRVEIWAIGPRCPFIPSTTLDRWLSALASTNLQRLGDWRHLEHAGAFEPPAPMPS